MAVGWERNSWWTSATYGTVVSGSCISGGRNEKLCCSKKQGGEWSSNTYLRQKLVGSHLWTSSTYPSRMITRFHAPPHPRSIPKSFVVRKGTSQPAPDLPDVPAIVCLTLLLLLFFRLLTIVLYLLLLLVLPSHSAPKVSGISHQFIWRRRQRTRNGLMLMADRLKQY